MDRPSEALLRKIVDAVVRAVDPAKLEHELDALREEGSRRDAEDAEGKGTKEQASPSASSAPPAAHSDLVGRLVLADILDESILGARQGDKAYPLRLLFTHLGEGLASDTGLALACALNVYFRAAMDEEVKMRLGLEASRLYYRFADERGLPRDLTAQTSPLLATLLSSELARVRFESIDAAKVFDSQVHERTEDSDGASSQIRSPATFLCRVSATNMLRARALVRT